MERRQEFWRKSREFIVLQLPTSVQFLFRIKMSLNRAELIQLKAVVNALQKIIATNGADGARSKPKRLRRSGKELSAFRKMLRTERKNGVPVATLARRHGISTTYIYQL
jgi:DNA invertase Pin-like site-specific DNA recombinase